MVFVFGLTTTDRGLTPTAMVVMTVFVVPSITDTLFELEFVT